MIDIIEGHLNELFNTIKQLKTDREKILKAAFPDNSGFGFNPPKMVVDKLLYHYTFCITHFV